jgi:1A family penicillin-binding protein
MSKNKWWKFFNLKKSRRRKKKKIPFKKKLVYYLPIGLFVGLIFVILTSLIAFAWVASDLPSPDQVVRREGFATKIYDRDGELLYDVYRQAKRTPVSLEEVPNELKWATIAIEDKDFYSHPGFSLRGYLRAVYKIIFEQKLQGGSTLTQQLVKNALLTSERTLVRKYKELILTLQIERKYSKDEILQMYLNEAPYGGPAWGVEAAAERYFNTSVKDLNLVESAILAGLPQRPTAYSPYKGDVWQGRTKDVLRRMYEDGYISDEERNEAIGRFEEISFADPEGVLEAPHFVMYVRNLLAEKYGDELVEGGGLKVTTSLDMDLQKQAEKIVAEEIDRVEGLNISNGASVVLDPETGEILAMVGSKDYQDDEIEGKFNVISQGLRQPGSAIKPVTYLTGLKKGYTASTMIMDVKTVFPLKGQPDYVPVNYDGSFHGPIQVRYALGNSINVPAVKMLAMVGLESMLETAQQMGMSTLAPSKENLSRLGLSTTLGGGDVVPLELASAYQAFANGGTKREPVSILKVEDKEGKIIFEHKKVTGSKVISPGEAFIISHILADNEARAMTFGQSSGLVIPGREVAVKTGTTNDMRDNWAVGWTPNVLVLSWVGNNDNSAMKRVASGISGATPIWRRIMTEAINQYGYESFQAPDDVVTAEVDAVSGYRAHDGFPSRVEYFLKGTEPPANDPIHVKLKVCPQTGQLATPPQVARGEYEEKEFFKFKEEDPVSWDGKNRWQEGILSWVAEQNNPKYNPPTEYCEVGGAIEVGIDSPQHESTVGNNFSVDLKADSVNSIDEIKVYIDGDLKKTFTSKPYKMDVNLEDGAYILKVVAEDSQGNVFERESKFGVNVPWDYSPSPTPEPTSEPTSTPIPTVELTPTSQPTVTATPTQ